MSRNAIFWIIFVVLAVAAEGFILIENDRFEKENRALWSAFSPSSNLAKIEVVFSDGKKRLFVGNLEGEVYPLRLALESVAQTGHFSLTASPERIENLAGIGGNGKWKIYRNHQLQNEKLDQLTIAGGNSYSLRFER